MDGKQLIKPEVKGSENLGSSPRNLQLNSLQETGFIEYMDPGTWYLALYNDGKKMEQVLLLSSTIGKAAKQQKPFVYSTYSAGKIHFISSDFFYFCIFVTLSGFSSLYKDNMREHETV